MIFTTDELRRLQNFYGEQTLDELLKWGDEVVSIGRPIGHGPWVDSDGRIRPAGDTFTVFDQNQAVLILRPEPRKVKVQQLRLTPLTDKERDFRAGEWVASLGIIYQYVGVARAHDGILPGRGIPYRLDLVEVEIEVEEDAL